jgi:hypothetical protein
MIDLVLDADTARELALFAGLVWDDDRDVLAPLVDAVAVWVEEDQLDELARPIVDQLWADGLRDDIERALLAYGNAPAEAFADLELGAGGSRLALAYVQQGAVDLGGPGVAHRCLCCVEEALAVGSAERRGALAHETAVELALVSGGDPEARLRGLALLAERSLPRLSAALLALDFDAVVRDVMLAQC